MASVPSTTMFCGSDGHAEYSKAFVGRSDSWTSFLVSATALQCLNKIIQEIERRQNYHFTFADFGTADGGSIIGIMNKMIELVIQECGPEAVMSVILEDQASNDFNSLFKILNGLVPSLNTKMIKTNNVHIFATSTSMYERCLPYNSVDIAFCTFVLHWLSRKPCNIKDSLSTEFGANEEERKIFSEQAASDWLTFLQNRAMELKPDGYLIILSIGSESSSTLKEVPGGYSTLSAVLKQFLRDDIITQEEFYNITMQAYFRSEEEYRVPFKDSSAHKLGLHIESCVYKDVVLLKKIEDSKVNDSAAVREYANAVIAFIKPWLYNTLFYGLSENRNTEEKRRIVDKYFDKLYQNILDVKMFPEVGLQCIEIVISKSRTL